MKEYEIIVAKRIRQLVGCLEDMIERSDEKTNVMVDMTLWLKYFRWALIALGVMLFRRCVIIAQTLWATWRSSPNSPSSLIGQTLIRLD